MIPFTVYQGLSNHLFSLPRTPTFKEYETEKKAEAWTSKCLPFFAQPVTFPWNLIHIILKLLSWSRPRVNSKLLLNHLEYRHGLKSTSFIVIMRLHQGLTYMRSQKKPTLHFDDSFTLCIAGFECSVAAHASIIQWLVCRRLRREGREQRMGLFSLLNCCCRLQGGHICSSLVKWGVSQGVRGRITE